MNKINYLENLVNDLSTQLADSYFQFIHILDALTETTEKFYDGGHARFVSEKSAQIAQKLGMNEEDEMEIKIAGLMHDIGKIGFQETLLFKFPNEMTQVEYTQYTKHSEFGYNILNNSKLFHNISEIVYQHHEKLDGSGFPRHLTKEQIHPSAKIIVVVDYYHNSISKIKRNRTETNNSITNTLSYLEDSKDRYISTMNYLEKKKNILFEPKVVDLLTEIIEGERRNFGIKKVIKMAVNAVELGMIFAEDYYTSYGMLIAAKGEPITKDSRKALMRCMENGEIPSKILIIK